MKATANQNINVKLTLIGQDGASGWEMDIAGQGKGGPNGYPAAKVAHGSSADFQFVITGPNTQNITFATTNPISVSLDDGTGKSPATAGINTDQIVDVSGGGSKVLKFKDLNSDPAVNLTYQLNFTGADPLDPIIQNGGGGGNKDFLYAVAALIGLAVLATLALVWLRARARSRATNDPA